MARENRSDRGAMLALASVLVVFSLAVTSIPAGAYYYDTDGDGLPDFYEIKHGLFETNSIADEKADWDGDLIDDAVEDANQNGIVDVGETDPYSWDTDGDGLSDGIELGYAPQTSGINTDADGDGLVNALDLDSDNDMLWDSVEEQVQVGDVYRDGVWEGVGSDETNWLEPDTDEDGLFDGLEVALVRQHPHGGSYDPIIVAHTYDTDEDSISDGDEFRIWGTDFLDDDSDNDDYHDGDELNQGAPPPVEYGDDDTDYIMYNDPDQDGMNNAVDYDSDNDGLIDEDETVSGGGRALTDPYDYDTDDDGFSDGYEVNTAGTDPTTGTDTDGDGWMDGWEVAWFKTDPDETDSDGDGIDDNIENPLAGFDPEDPHTGLDTDDDGLINALDWDSDNDGLDDNYEELDGDGVSSGDDGDGIYEGGTDDETDAYDADSDDDGLSDGFEARITCTDPNDAEDDGDPIAAGDEVMTYKTDFFDSDTDGDGLDEGMATGTDQADYNTDGGSGRPWADSSVDALDLDADGDGIWDNEEVVAGSDGYVTDPYDWDTDDDGLADGQEVYIWGTDPTDEDTDDDDLEDGEEALTYGTDPLDPDTDGDDVMDGTEIEWWQTWAEDVWPPAPNPLDPDTDGDGLKDGITITGYYYDTDGEWVSWEFYEGPVDSELVPDGFPNILDPDSDWREQHSPGAGYDYYDFHDRTEYAYRLYVATMRSEKGGVWRDFVDDEPLNPGNPDTDGDGYTDWSEVSRGTDPLDGTDFSAVPYTPMDTDGDGLWDIEEFILEGTTTGTMWDDTDYDDDGLTDSDELHPTLPKLDDDWGEPPWPYEWWDEDGIAQVWPTSPLHEHSENDLGIVSSDNISDYDEVAGTYAGPDWDRAYTNPHYDDTDGDGISDYTESVVLDGVGDPDYDPTDFDMDDDLLTDHQEDQDADGNVDTPAGYDTDYAAETDPLDGDTDDDAIYDGDERTYHTYPQNMDTDGDGLYDGLEVGYYYDGAWPSNNLEPNNGDPSDTDDAVFGAGDQDITTQTDPRLTDSDFDCIDDDDEDLDGDGMYDSGDGETDAQSRDSDGDYLYDYYEYNGCVASAASPCNFYTFCDNSSDPTEAYDSDTDADGMPDWVEYEQGCDPDDDTDSDDDGVDDGFEYDGVDYMTDATMADTDMDGHDDYIGWFSGVDDIPDEVESDDDCDGDGIINAMDVDSDNDWIRDHDEGDDITTDDIESDGYVDILDGDRDNDYLADPLEMGLATYDPRDMDTDDDGLYDGEEYWHPIWHTEVMSCGSPDTTLTVTMTDPGVDNQSRDTDRDGWTVGLSYYFHDGFEAGRTGGIPENAGTTPPTPGTDDDPLIWDADGTANSDPRYHDTDFDGLWEFDEDTDYDGEDADVGVGNEESDPWDADTDDDALFDSYEVDYFGVAMAIDCDTDDDLLPDGLELGALFEMPRELQAFWMWPGPTDAQQYDYTNWTSLAGGSACGLYAPGRDHLDTEDNGAYTTDPADDDTDDDGLTDGEEDTDYDGHRDGNSPFDLTSDWNAGAGPGETDPNEWDTDRGGEDDNTEVSAGDDPLLYTDGDWDIDIDPDAEDAADDTLDIGVAGTGIIPGNSGTSTFRVWITDLVDNPDPDGPSSTTVIESLYVRSTSLHWAGPHPMGPRDDTPDTEDWFHYTHVEFTPERFRLEDEPEMRSDFQNIDVTVNVPWGAMPGWYFGYVQVETRRFDTANDRNMEQELPDDYIVLRVWVAPHKDLDICDDDGDPRGVGVASDPWNFPVDADSAQMHLVGAPGHRDTIMGMFRVANPNTYPDGSGPYWPYPGDDPDGVNDYNGLPAVPWIERTWDVPWDNDDQGNVDLTGNIRAFYSFGTGPADPTSDIWFTKRDTEGPVSVLKDGFELATTDSFNVRIETTDLPEGLYEGSVTVFEDVSPYNGVLDIGEVYDTFKLMFWLTYPDLDIDDDYANMSGNELTIDIDPANYVGDVVEEVLMWNPEIPSENVDPWDGPSLEDIYDFYYYDTSDTATGTMVSSRHHKVPMNEDRPNPDDPLSFWVYSDEYSDPETPRYPVRVWLYSDEDDTLVIADQKKLYLQVPTLDMEVWELPAGTYRPWHPEAFNVVPDDAGTEWTWQFGQGIVPITVRGMATGMQYDAHDWVTPGSDFYDYEDGVVYNPSRVDSLQEWMDYFYLIVNIAPFVDVEFDLSAPWSVTGEGGETVCGDAMVYNMSNVEITSVELEATNLIGSEYSGVILADNIELPNDFTLSWPDDESGTFEICVSIPEGTRADTYEGEVTIVADGEGAEWVDEMNTLPISVVVECVHDMDVTETAYGVAGNLMTLTPGPGGTSSKQFELCNLGDCDVTGTSYEVTGLPTGITVTATMDATVPWQDCIVGTATASWTSPWPESGLYHGLMTVTADDGLSDSFNLDVMIAPDMEVTEDGYDLVDNMMTLTPTAPGSRGTDSGEFEVVNTGVTDLTGITGVEVTGLPTWVTATVDVDSTLAWAVSPAKTVGEVMVTWDNSHPEVAAGEYTTNVTVTANGGISDNFILKVVITEVENAAFYTESLTEDGEAGVTLETEFVVENTGNVMLADGRVTFAASELAGDLSGAEIPAANVAITPASAEIPHEGTATFAMAIDVPEGLLGQDFEGTVDLYLDGDWVDQLDVTVTLERGEDDYRVYPNPYRVSENEGRGGVYISLPREVEDVTLKIYDMFGMLVAELTEDSGSRDSHLHQWDLKNDDGKAVASGMYIVTIDTGDEVVTRKIMVIK
ncbi:MAG: T9SS type A sorting domain-containing protein [Candidatus Eisenbacteria bacterium]|nr:T9SS type A sorting domain-containing protein [Candidatus Eisenbacteria bacterium]